MFLIRFLRWLFGWVRFEAEGGFPERLLNLAARNNIQIWDATRSGIKLTGNCFVRHYGKLRPFVRKSGMRMHVKERHGVPFFLHRYRARAGIIVGIFVYILILQFFSGFIWVIDVTGNKSVPQSEIVEALEDLGVRRGGSFQKLDIKTIQMVALQRLPALSWLAVNPEGSIAHIVVSERKKSVDKIDTTHAANVKAARDGIVVSTEVYEGTALVQPGDAIAKGMILVSGVMDSETGPILKTARAKIMAETQRELQVEIPLKEVKMLPSGEIILRPTFYLFGFSVPFYTSGKIDGEYEHIIREHPLTASDLQLPIGFTNEYFRMLKPTEIIRNEGEAAAIAKIDLNKKQATELAKAKILSSEESFQLKNGNYVLTRRFRCVEDVAVTEQIGMQ